MIGNDILCKIFQSDNHAEEEDILVNRDNSCSNWSYEEVFDPNQRVNQVYVHEEDDHVLQYYISQPSKNISIIVNVRQGKPSRQTSAVIRNSGTVCSMDTVVVVVVVRLGAAGDGSTDGLATEFLVESISS